MKATSIILVTIGVACMTFCLVNLFTDDSLLKLGDVDQSVDYEAVMVEDRVYSDTGGYCRVTLDGFTYYFSGDNRIKMGHYTDTFVVHTSAYISGDIVYLKEVYASRETVCEVSKAEGEKAKNALKKRKEAIKDEKQAAREKKRMVRNALKGCK